MSRDYGYNVERQPLLQGKMVLALIHLRKSHQNDRVIHTPFSGINILPALQYDLLQVYECEGEPRPTDGHRNPLWIRTAVLPKHLTKIVFLVIARLRQQIALESNQANQGLTRMAAGAPSHQGCPPVANTRTRRV